LLLLNEYLATDNGSSRQPRHIAFYENKAYVCSFDGTVARIDTTSLQIEKFLKKPEEIRKTFVLRIRNCMSPTLED